MFLFFVSVFFFVYVYVIWAMNHRVLGSIEAEASTKASDFAVLVSRLPAHGSDPAALRQHFAFFGEVASVAVSTDHEQLMKLLLSKKGIKTKSASEVGRKKAL